MRIFVSLYLSIFVSTVFSADKIMSLVDMSEIAVDFTLPDPVGKMIRLSDYKGKYVLVNFWALWCSPCVKELPAMQKMYESLQDDGFEILAIHVGPKEGKMAPFLSEKGIKFTVVIDEVASIKGWKVPALPISYLVSPTGKLVYKAVGVREWSEKAMRELMAFN